jgi:hypothetical protein
VKCAVHSEVDAAGFCRNCGKALCPECMREVKGTRYCEECLAAIVTGTPAAPGAPAAPAGGHSPALAFFLGLIPGLGAVYNGEYTKALIHVMIWCGLFAMGLHNVGGDLTPVIWTAFGLFPLYMAVEASRTAQAQRHGQKSPAPLAEGESRRPIGAIVLIALGALFLLGNFGLLETEWVERSWPLLLIALGLYLFWKRSRGNA